MIKDKRNEKTELTHADEKKKIQFFQLTNYVRKKKYKHFTYHRLKIPDTVPFENSDNKKNESMLSLRNM